MGDVDKGRHEWSVRLEEACGQSLYLPVAHTGRGPGTVLLQHVSLFCSPSGSSNKLRRTVFELQNTHCSDILQKITKRASTITLERTAKASPQCVAFDFLSVVTERKEPEVSENGKKASMFAFHWLSRPIPTISTLPSSLTLCYEGSWLTRENR